MLDQNTFTETIHEVSEIIRTAPSPMSRDEILSYFKDMELDDTQEEMVLEFLLTPHEEEIEEPQESTEESPVQLTDDEEIKAEAIERELSMLDDDTEMPEKKDAETISENDVLPDSKVFQMYLKELEALPSYTQEDLESFYDKLLAGDAKMIQKISDAWLPKVLELAKKYTTLRLHFEDVVQEGNVGLFLALSELCGAAGESELEQKLTNAIVESMRAYITEMTGEDDSEQTIIGKINLVNESKKYLIDQNGTDPTIDELSEYTKLSKEELADILVMIQKAEKK